MFCKQCGNQVNENDQFCGKCGAATAEAHAIDFQTYEAQKAKNLRRGLWWIIGPWAGLIALMVAYAILQFVLSAAGAEGSGAVAGRIIRAMLGLAGIVIVILCMLGIPLGIIAIAKYVPLPGKYDVRSGKKEQSVVPPEIRGWNWGAAGLGWIWGVSHGVWISLLQFVPLINLFFWIWMGVNGNELAWKAQRWESVEQFKTSQDKWKVWGIVFLCLSLLLTLFSVLSDTGSY